MAARVEAGHEVPRVVLLVAYALAPVVRPQDNRRNVGKFCGHKLDDGARVELRTVKAEEGQIALDQVQQILVTDAVRVVFTLLEVLGQDRAVALIAQLGNGLRQHGITREVLVGEEFSGKINIEGKLIKLRHGAEVGRRSMTGRAKNGYAVGRGGALGLCRCFVAAQSALMTTPQVVVAGSFNQDLTWTTLHFPHPGETTTGRFRSGPGGKGSNQAVAAARAGALTAFIGAIGKDPFGDALPAFYDGEGIQHHLAVKNEPTGNAGIWVESSGENEIIVALGANLLLDIDDVPEGLVENARIVLCQHESSLALNRDIFARARQSGVTTLLNTAPMREDFDPKVLEQTDILVPNETEFVTLVRLMGISDALSEEALIGIDIRELHTLCRRLGVPTVVITLGKRGCFISTAEEYRQIPAYTNVKVVDTTGAGDAFVGGFAAGYCRSEGDVFEAARFGNATAALSVTKAGTAPSMPCREEIEAFLSA